MGFPRLAPVLYLQSETFMANGNDELACVSCKHLKSKLISRNGAIRRVNYPETPRMLWILISELEYVFENLFAFI